MSASLRRSAGLLVLVSAVASPLAAQVNLFQTGTPYDSPALETFDATGASMAGMQLTWTFTDQTGGSGTWGAIGGGSCGVNSGGLRVFVGCNDLTIDEPWRLLNMSGRTLTSLQFNGAAGRTVFDCSWTGSACAQSVTGTPEPGTPGSGFGLSHSRVGGTVASMPVGIYRHAIGVNGAAPVGDVFEQFTLLFFAGLPDGESYEWRMDTDNSSFAAPPPVQVVPEPSTYALLATGLVALGLTARRRASRR